MSHKLDSPCYPLKQRREEWGHLRVVGRRRIRLWGGEVRAANKVCSMLFPRCIHRRLCCHSVPLHEFHTTRPYLRESPDAFQIDPFNAHAIVVSSKPASPGRSQSKSDSRKIKTFRERKQRKEGSDGMEHFFEADKFLSRVRLCNRRDRCPRTVGGTEATGVHLTGGLKGRVSSPSSPMEREAHVGASKNAGGSSCSFHVVLFHLLPSTARSQRR